MTMTRQAEVAALHGHPTISEDNATIVRLRRQFPDWQIDRTPHGFEAFHRTRGTEPAHRTSGCRHVFSGRASLLEEALFMQQALRGDGPAGA